MKNICIITGTRAEYGLLKPIIERVENDIDLNLQLIVTGMHLSAEFGMTFNQIENDGYYITDKIEMLLSSDTSIGISKSMGLAMISFSELYERIRPDIIIVLGDRYEIFAAVSAANISRIPIAHIHGGETTEGAYDEALRHCITKMSYLHFTSTEIYRNRVIQLGEHPERVFNVGAIGIENIKTLSLLSKKELEQEINFNLDYRYAIVVFHPVTLENNTAKVQFEEILNALEKMDELNILFIKGNSDSSGRVINQMIDDITKKNPKKYTSFTSLSILQYLSAMKYCEVVVGNSSSGILEAPSFKKPTINIGDRQKGRIQSKSIINCEPKADMIYTSLKKSISEEFKTEISDVINPYGEGNVSLEIIDKIKMFLNRGIDLKKKFYDL